MLSCWPFFSQSRPLFNVQLQFQSIIASYIPTSLLHHFIFPFRPNKFSTSKLEPLYIRNFVANWKIFPFEKIFPLARWDSQSCLFCCFFSVQRTTTVDSWIALRKILNSLPTSGTKGNMFRERSPSRRFRVSGGREFSMENQENWAFFRLFWFIYKHESILISLSRSVPVKKPSWCITQSSW